MKNNGKQRALYIGLCVLAAVVVWIFADNYGTDGTPITYEKWFRDIPITYTSETVLTGRGLMLLEDGTDATVDLRMEGSHWDLALLDSDYIRVTVDLSDVTRTGEQTVSSILVSFTYPYFNGKIIRTQQSPSPITLNVAELYHKTVEVRCEITGNVAEGYSAGELQISPTEIEVRGDQADVDAVSYAKVTLDLGEDATSTVSGELPVQLYDENDQLLESSSLQTTDETIQVTLPVYVTKEMRLTMDFQESAGARSSNVNCEITPSTILVSGPAEVLNSMDSIVLDEFDLASLGDTTNYSYAIPIPEGCENLSGVTRATVRISFRDMRRATVTATNFQLQNAPEERNVDLLTEQLDVSIFGTSENVEAVDRDHLLVTVDLSNFGSAVGTYTVPAEVRVLGYDVGVSGGPYQVRVTISEQTTDQPAEPDTPAGENPNTGDETT